jgi:uncharacterized protein (DUF302 family)
MTVLGPAFLLAIKHIKVMNAKGVVIRPSRQSVGEVIDRLQTLLKKNGATIYTRIDQQAEAGKVGIHVPPLEFLLFGNPKGGGPIMAEHPLVALDLPLKVIAWEDDQGKVWLAYNDPKYIQDRYSLPAVQNSPFALDRLIDQTLK